MAGAAEKSNGGEDGGQHTFAVKTNSSVYNAVAKILRGLPGWTETSSSQFCDLLLGERWDMPWPLLAAEPQGRRPGAVNHVRGTRQVTVKGLMRKSLADATAHGPQQDYNENRDVFVPQTFLVVPRAPGAEQTADCEREAFTAAARDGGAVWVCKPTAGCHGSGIRLFRDPTAALEYVDGHFVPRDSPAGSEHGRTDSDSSGAPRPPAKPWLARRRAKPQAAWLAQRCVDPPMLIDGRKFDIRAVGAIADDLSVWFYGEYILRMCSEPYDGSDIDCPFRNISNHCIQVESENYGKGEEGNERFSASLREALARQHGPEEGARIAADIERQMEAAVLGCVGACRGYLSRRGSERQYGCVQILGMDFIIDSGYKVWLLEANGSPAVAERMLPDFARDVVGTLLRPMVEGAPARTGHFRCIQPAPDS
ncbi:unnamed protein product [Pedinophyceae sp. YPF-701]|nr:unnamed protein product [Pedinophyceae sp. YPF-701]